MGPPPLTGGRVRRPSLGPDSHNDSRNLRTMSRNSPAAERRIALVLGGGGMKGFAHIGVMKALEERGIVPTTYAGTSIGAMLAAARLGGVAPDEMAKRARTLRRRDLFRINHF